MTRAAKWLKLACVLMVMWPAGGIVFAEKEVSAPETAETEAEAKRQRWVVLPVIGLNAETSWQFGAAAVHFLPIESTEDQDSTLQLVAFGTLKNQYHLALEPDIYLDNGLYHSWSEIGVRSWPANFYGIGNESPAEPDAYDARLFTLTTVLERRFAERFVIGVYGRYINELVAPTTGGILESGEITGANGGASAGLGLRGAYDTRDNTNDPRRGQLCRYGFNVYDSALGGDFSFRSHNVDLRTYIPLHENGILALAGWLRMTEGDVPFRELSTPDGSKVLRGIEKGRYRDKHVMSGQLEYRLQLARRWGVTAFGEAAQVAPTLSAFSADAFTYSTGIGIRFAMNPAERFNVRLDTSWVDDGLGVVIDIREAF